MTSRDPIARVSVLSTGNVRMHEDHIGGVNQLPKAELVVSHREWQSLRSSLPEARGLLRRHIELPGLRWRPIFPVPTSDPALAPFTASHDLFDDGSLVLVPTPGHTPGSMSMLVRRPGRPTLMMVGDLTYDVHLLAAGHVPGMGDRRQTRASTALTNDLRKRHPDIVILPAHDPGAAARLENAVGGATATGAGRRTA
jgi:glyoxylase-like metal-dependent hydrolase (beta-lactamase superfamily II)